MILFDTHTHLFAEQFAADRNLIVDNAIRSGVKYMVLPGIDSSYLSEQLKMSEYFPENCFLGIGLHPSNVKEDFEKELQIVANSLNNNNVVAIGETGIDLYWDKTNLKNQTLSFEYQIELAIKNDLPIVIHVREAFEETLKIVEKHNCKELTGVFHSFTGDSQIAERIISLGGFMFGINGIVTYKNSELPKVLVGIPKEKIILETDSPWLPPVPHRGKRNESEYLIHIAEKVASVYNIPIQEIAEITTGNALKLFKKINKN